MAAGSAVLAGPAVVSRVTGRRASDRALAHHRAASARHARAQAVLQAAELRTGVKGWGSNPFAENPCETRPPKRSGGSGEVAIAADAQPRTERPHLRALPSEPTSSQRTAHDEGPEFSWLASVADGGLPVQANLRQLIPGGALAPGLVCSVQGSVSLLFGLLAEASQDGAWIAFVGTQTAGIVAAAEAGLALDRLALVPQPGLDAARVVAALLDGMDAVVIGPQTALSAADRRRLTARARERGAVIISTVPWEGAGISLAATAGSWQGADAGAGWLREHSLLVQRTGRGMAARPRTFEVSVPLVYRSDLAQPRSEQAEPKPVLRLAS